MKKLLLFLCCCICSLAVKAQDHVYLKNGEVLEVYVKKITGTLIYYSSSPGSPKRFIKRHAVEKVVYKRGREVMMETPQSIEAARRREARRPYNNLLTASPLPWMFWGQYAGLGVGLEYERYLDAQHHLSIHAGLYGGAVTETGVGEKDNNYPYTDGLVWYGSPGIRFHPLSRQKRLDYSIGIAGFGGRMNMTTYNESIGAANINTLATVTGVLVENDVVLTGRKRKIVLGVHTAFGPIFGDYGNGNYWMGQVGLRIGSRF